VPTPLTPENGFEAWSLADWNKAVFRHYFRSNRTGDVVTCMPVTDRALRAIVGSLDADPARIRTCFIDKVKENDVERCLDDAYWNRTRIIHHTPPYVAYLFLTCLAASGDDDTVEVGDFRDRLMELLDTPRKFPLNNLAGLWKRLARWLQRESARDPYVKRLVLPSPGREVRIGHSKRLAFPVQRDRNKLIVLFHGNVRERTPTRDRLVRILDANESRFSSAFIAEWQEFKNQYRRGLVDFQRSHFWSAIEWALAESWELSGDDYPAVSLMLLTDTSGGHRLAVMLDSGNVPLSYGQVRLSPAAHDRAKYVLRIGPEVYGIDEAAKALLSGRLRGVLPLVHDCAITKLVEQGVLVFAVDEHGAHECRSSLPESGVLEIVIRNGLSNAFQLALQRAQIATRRSRSSVDGWASLSGVDAKSLAKIDFSKHELFKDVKCLNQPPEIYRLTLRDGVRNGEEWMGFLPLLPSVVAKGAEAVNVISLLGDTPHGSPIVLERSPGTEPSEFTFRFPVSRDSKSLEGPYRITARDREGVLATRDIAFRLNTIGVQFKEPNGGLHRIESGVTDMTRYDRDMALQLCGTQRPIDESDWIPNDTQTAPPGLPTVALERKDLTPCFTSPSPEVPRATADFTELAAALSLRKSGLGLRTMLDLAKSHFPTLRSWDVLRAWQEAGCFDRIMDERGDERFFARAPRCCLHESKGLATGTLLGLATATVRNSFQQAALRRGVAVEFGASFTPCLASPLRLTARTEDPIAEVARDIGLPVVRCKSDWAGCVARLAEVAGRVTFPRPLNYKENWVQWSSTSRGGVSVTRHQRRGGHGEASYREKPDLYTVEYDNREWWSYSRNWALLVAFSLAGSLPFAIGGGHCIVRVTKDGVFLPLPVGRLAPVIASAFAGPVESEASCGTYVYPLGSEAEVRGFLAAFLPPPLEFEKQIARLVDLNRRGVGRRQVDLPNCVKTALLQIEDSPRVRALVKGKVTNSVAALACHLVIS
jgi:hypothetical protein